MKVLENYVFQEKSFKFFCMVKKEYWKNIYKSHDIWKIIIFQNK